MLILKASALQMRMDRCQTPSPCGYSLLSKRESCFFFVFQWFT